MSPPSLLAVTVIPLDLQGGSGSTLPGTDNVTANNVVINLPDISTDQSSVIVVLAFISGASFLLLVLIFSLFLFCRSRALSLCRAREDDNISNTSIIYNIEQDSVSITPSLHKQIQEILLVDDITGLLEPSLAALKAAHKVMGEMVSMKLILTNMKHLDMLRRSIHHIPVLCDAAIQVTLGSEPIDYKEFVRLELSEKF